MVHSLLGGIPELVDTVPESINTANIDLVQGTVTEVDRVADNETTGGNFGSSGGGPDSHDRLHSESADGTSMLPNISEQTRVSHEDTMGCEDGLDQSTVSSDAVPGSDTPPADSSNPNTKSALFPETIDHSFVDGPHALTPELAASVPLPDSRPASPIPFPEHSSPAQSTTPLFQEVGSIEHRSPSPSAYSLVPSRSRATSLDTTCPSSPMQPFTIANEPTSHSGKSVPSKLRNKPAPLSLAYLLHQADVLLTTYPPSHPSLHVAEIMGPDSAMRTWRPLPISTKVRDAIPEEQPYCETDDYLETLVNSSHIVIPSPPPSPLLGPRLPARKGKLSPRAASKALFDPRRITLRLGALTSAERRVLFIGALLVVGAAMALKSSKVSCVDSIVKGSEGDGLKRAWNGKWTIVSSVVAAWGRGLP